MSKIFEKCTKLRLVNFLDKHKFLSYNKFGFQIGMSSSDPFIKTSHFIHDNTDKRFKVLGIFLDSKKTFDSVKHDVLNNKLNYCGIRGNHLNSIKSFISNGPQQVKLDDIYSKEYINYFSVTQRMVLGPLLFINLYEWSFKY